MESERLAATETALRKRDYCRLLVASPSEVPKLRAPRCPSTGSAKRRQAAGGKNPFTGRIYGSTGTLCPCGLGKKRLRGRRPPLPPALRLTPGNPEPCSQKRESRGTPPTFPRPYGPDIPAQTFPHTLRPPAGFRACGRLTPLHLFFITSGR